MNKKDDIQFKSNEEILNNIEENKINIHQKNLENINKSDGMINFENIQFKSKEEILNYLKENKDNIYQKNLENINKNDEMRNMKYIEFKTREEILNCLEENKKNIHQKNLENINKNDEMENMDNIQFKTREEILNELKENKDNIEQKNLDNINKNDEMMNMENIRFKSREEIINNLKKNRFSIYKDIYVNLLSIYYINAKKIYTCDIEFCCPSLSLSFDFNDLSFLHDKDFDVLKTTKVIDLYNLTDKDFDNFDFHNYYSLIELKLNNIIINNIEIISKLYNVSAKISTHNVKVNHDLIESLEKFSFNKGIYNNTIYYSGNFEFEIDINKEILKNIKCFSNCIYIKLSYMELYEEDLLFLSKDCFSSMKNLDLSHSKLKNINFVSYDSLSNLEKLILSNNEIEDINPLSEDNFKCKNLILLELRNNPIKKGIEIFKQNFFQNECLYYLIDNIQKNNDLEYYVSLTIHKNILKYFYFDFFVPDIKSISEFFELKYIFFNSDIRYDELKTYNFDITEEMYIKKEKMYQYIELLFLNIRKNFKYFIYSLNYGLEDDEIVKHLFNLFYDKGFNYLNELSDIDILLNVDKIKSYFSFLDTYSFIDYNIKRLSEADKIVLSEFHSISVCIEKLCDSELLKNLKILNLSKNSNIANLSDLKNAKFVQLQELILSYNEIYNLNDIEMEKYPFYNLKVLDLSHNHIEKTEPIIHFKNLIKLNLEYNEITTSQAVILIEKLPVCEKLCLIKNNFEIARITEYFIYNKILNIAY